MFLLYLYRLIPKNIINFIYQKYIKNLLLLNWKINYKKNHKMHKLIKWNNASKQRTSKIIF